MLRTSTAIVVSVVLKDQLRCGRLWKEVPTSVAKISESRRKSRTETMNKFGCYVNLCKYVDV